MDERSAPRVKKRRFFKKEDAALYIMAMPVALYLLVFAYAPMAGVLMAFQKYNVIGGFFKSPFIGFNNFGFLFSSTDSFRMIGNTVLYHFAYLVTGMALSVTAAIIMSMLRSARVAKTLQTIYMMPHFLSWSVVALMVYVYLAPISGVFNQLLSTARGVPVETDWYMTREFWPPFLVFMNAWKGVGYSTVLYLAVISGIPVDYYEAAMIDGAKKFQQARYITFPHLRFIISISLIMSMGGIVRGDFGLHFLVTRNSGILRPVTEIIDTYIYRALIGLQNVGLASAAGFFQSTVGLFFVLAANWIVNKIDPDVAMF